MNLKRIKVFATFPWSKDRKLYGCPIEFNIHTKKYGILFRPFSKAQAFDWKNKTWTGNENNMYNPKTFDANKIKWKHLVIFPENSNTWEFFEECRINGYHNK